MGWNQFEKLKKKNPREIERLFFSLLLRTHLRITHVLPDASQCDLTH
jgi:hypothetical protein